MNRLAKIAGLAAIALAISSGIAHADQIDGTWCSPTGESITIEGPQAVIPSGNMIDGNYDRHHFDYVIPEGDVDAGAKVMADQIDDNTIRVAHSDRVQENTGASEIWIRCNVTS